MTNPFATPEDLLKTSKKYHTQSNQTGGDGFFMDKKYAGSISRLALAPKVRFSFLMIVLALLTCWRIHLMLLLCSEAKSFNVCLLLVYLFQIIWTNLSGRFFDWKLFPQLRQTYLCNPLRLPFFLVWFEPQFRQFFYRCQAPNGVHRNKLSAGSVKKNLYDNPN